MSHSQEASECKEAVGEVADGDIKDCSTQGCVEGAVDLDNRIRSALDELESSEKRLNGYSLSSTRTAPREQDAAGGVVSEGSSSDSGGEDLCPNAMGYMPLPQDPDTEEVPDIDSLSSLTTDVENRLDVKGHEEDCECTQDEQVVSDGGCTRDAVPKVATVDLKKGMWSTRIGLCSGIEVCRIGVE
jgi:hypothetical protein